MAREKAIHQKAVMEYINRIGAEVINFRTFQVREWKGKYYFEKAFIRVTPEGEVECPAEFAPTAKEADAIKKEWNEGALPNSVPARSTKGIKVLNDKSKLYLFYNTEGMITFVQERTEPKAYLPWSFWSDGLWRQMQPDGKIPLWKPKRPAKYVPRNKVMIHEGAKAADAAWQLPKTHPWYEEFDDYEHWAIVGGALAVNRADYEDLKKKQASDVVYVCDNDHPGRSMLQLVSKNYGARLQGVVFDGEFPESWDCADPLPADFFEDGVYVGKPFAAYRKPATYATEKITPANKEEKPYYVARKHFLEEWHHVVQPECFIHRDYPDKLYTAKEFNNLVSPYSQVSETHRQVIKDDAGKGYAIAYDPGKKPGIYNGHDGHYINTHRTPLFRKYPKDGYTKADFAPFIEFMEHLIPNPEDRKELLRWCATLIARPSVKMHYGVLLISETQGVGKGTLGEKILAPLIGLSNSSFPGEEEIVESKYNYWMAHRRLAVVHEIYAGHSSRAYNKLKSVVTDKNIEVHRKYMADYRVENWVHIFACSNSPRALRLSLDDRRWLVPKVSEEKRPEKYWETFHHWLRRKEGLEKIKWWAENAFKDYVKTGQDAPWTSIKKDIVEEGMSDGQKLVYTVLEGVREGIKDPVLIDDNALVDLIKDELYEGRRNDRLEKPQTVRQIAKGLGYFIHPERIKNANWGTVLRPTRLICSSKADAERDPKELADRPLFAVKEFFEKHKRL
jgi:hypothetical protein